MLMSNIHQAKTHLSRLLEEVAKGREVIIAKAGKPVAKLVMYKEEKKLRNSGLLKGEIFISDDFDDELGEINKMFYGPDIDSKRLYNKRSDAVLQSLRGSVVSYKDPFAPIGETEWELLK